MRVGKVAKNAGWIIGCKLVKAILALFITMLTARCMGPSNYGLINYAAGIVAFFTPIMKLGIDSVLVHQIVQYPQKEGETVGTAMVLNVVSSILCIIGVTAVSAILNPGENETIVICALYSTMLIFQAIEMVQYWFHAKLMAKYISMAMVASYLCVSIFQIILLINQSHIYWFALSHSIDFLIIAVVLLVIYHRKADQPLRFSWERANALLRVGVYYIFSALMITVFQQTDRIMLKTMLGNEAVGFYSAAVTCSGMISFVFVAVIDSARPKIFEAHKIGKQKFEDALSKLYTVIIYSALFVSLLVTLFAPLIIHIMYGKEYAPSVNALRVSAWFITFSYIGTVKNIWIITNHKQKYLLAMNFCGAVTNIILNALLIPLYGVIGASIATVTSEIFTNVILGFMLAPIRENNMIMLKSLRFRNVIQIANGILGRR